MERDEPSAIWCCREAVAGRRDKPYHVGMLADARCSQTGRLAFLWLS